MKVENNTSCNDILKSGKSEEYCAIIDRIRNLVTFADIDTETHKIMDSIDAARNTLPAKDILDLGSILMLTYNHINRKRSKEPDLAEYRRAASEKLKTQISHFKLPE